MDRDFGLMHARLQTWFPFTIQVCLNGRSWLARQMDRRGMTYRQADNCFLRLDNPAGAQRLMDRLLGWDWPKFLGRIAGRVNPALPQVLRGYRVDYYWSASESEWASDVMFRSASALAAIYPALARGAITAFDSANVLRFLGKGPQGNFRAPITSDYRRRVEGLRVKHAVGSNSVKMYDKQGSVLRVETTVNDPRSLRVYRRKEGQPDGPAGWHRMRKGVADLRRRAEVSQGCNDRYFDALATLDTSTPLGKLVEPICRPTTLGPIGCVPCVRGRPRTSACCGRSTGPNTRSTGSATATWSSAGRVPDRRRETVRLGPHEPPPPAPARPPSDPENQP